MAPSTISLEVTNDHSVPVEPSLGGSVTVLNVSGDTLYYADNSQVSAANNQGSLTAGQSQTFSPPQWLRSASLSTVTVTVNDGGSSSSAIGNPAVTLSGTPTSGQVPTATSGAAASWQTPSSGGSGGSGLGSTWVDMCAAPYNHVPGDDVTVDLQAAINAANIANQDTTIYWSKPGVYNINGAQVTGSGTTGGIAWSYSGQILFPARHFSVGPITIRIMGLTPPPLYMDGLPATEALTAGGAVLVSNATSGNIFDAIPADQLIPNVNIPNTDVHVTLENISVRAPSNPQCGGIRGINLATLRTAGQVSIQTANPGVGSLTGTGIGITFPPYDNMALSRADGDLEVVGWPVGVAHSEHFTAENLYTYGCVVGRQPQGQGGVGHSTLIKRHLVQGCRYAIQPAGTVAMHERSLVDVGDQAGGPYPFWGVANDPTSLLYGEIVVQQWINQGGTPSAAGFNVIGGLNLTFVPYIGRRSEWPSDDFTRISTPSGPTNYLGASSNTHHVWASYINGSATQTSVWSTAGGVLKAAVTGVVQGFMKYQRGRAGLSRVVRSTFTLSGAYEAEILFARPIAGSNTNNFLLAFMGSVAQGGNANAIGIYKSINGVNTLLANTAASVVSAAVHTVDIVISNPVAGPYQVAVIVDGAAAALIVASGAGSIVGGAYQLAAAEIAQMTDTDPRHTQDGVGFVNDQNSSCSYFAVMPN